jgi:hypothetical protein
MLRYSAKRSKKASRDNTLYCAGLSKEMQNGASAGWIRPPPPPPFLISPLRIQTLAGSEKSHNPQYYPQPVNEFFRHHQRDAERKGGYCGISGMPVFSELAENRNF